jgi:hypothetical protein
MPSQISEERCFTDAVAFYRPRFKRRPKAIDADNYFSHAQAKYNRRRRHLYVNDPAARIVESAIGDVGLPAQRLGGVTLGPSESAKIAGRLQAFVSSQILPDLRDAFGRVAQEFSRAHSSRRIVTVINADPTVPATEVRKTEQEEESHRVLIEATGGSFSPQFLTKLLADPNVKQAVRRLHRIRPDIGTQIQEAHELAVVLMQGGWEDIGLSDGEAGSLWYSFVKLLITHHGDQAKAILKHGDPVYAQRVARRIRRELGVPKAKRNKARGGRRGDKT